MSGAATEPTDTRVLGRTLIDTFTGAWSSGDVDALVGVFSEDAQFFETPFGEPAVGIDAIRRYWADVPYNQSEITTTSGEIYAAGPWFSTEFKSVFRRRRTGEWVEARGAMFCETEAGKISEMRMYWHRR